MSATPAALPPLGLGVANMSDAEVRRAVEAALEHGYRMIDTAAAYRNERAVGAAITASGIPRDAITIVTKIWTVEETTREEIVAAVRRSADELGIDRIDLCLIHWPGRADSHVTAWEGLAAAREAGLSTLIGVSNFLPRHLDDLDVAGLPLPAVNQIERHPFHGQNGLRIANGARGIRTMAWSPLGKGRLVADPRIAEIATRIGRTPGQVALRWNLDRDVIVIPKSSNPERIRENADVLDFTLSPEDLALIDGLDERSSANAPLYALYQ